MLRPPAGSCWPWLADERRAAIPFVIPVVAAFASGAVASVIAGTATLSAYLTVAGAALSTIGALTKNEDISKFGAILSIGSGLTGAFAGAGAGATGAEAVSGMDVAADAGMGAMDAGGAALGGAGQEAFTAVTAEEMAGLGGGVEGPTAQEMAGLGADTSAGSGQQMLNDALTSSGNAAEQAGQMSFNDPTQSFGLMDAAQGGGYAQQPSLMDTVAQQQQPVPNTIMGSGSAQPQALAHGVKPVIQQGGQGLDKTSLNKWLTSASKWASGQNSLYGVNARDLMYMYGQSKSPEYELIDQRQRLLDRRQANLNAPIALGPTTKG